MIKRVLSLFLILTLLSAFSLPVIAKDYDETAIYYECYTLYPDFVNRVKSFGVTDEKIITFLGYIEKHLSTRDEELNEENFDQYMFDAIEYAFNSKKNIPVRDALSSAYPDAVPQAMKGNIPEEYMPIYNTVKRILFGITAPVVTLSGDRTALTVHHLYMPEDKKIIVGVYDTDGTLLHAYINPYDSISCDCETASYAAAFAFKGNSLAPLCETFTLKF